MTRTTACIALLLVLQSCIVMPERWREEVFEGIPHPDSNVERDSRLVMFIFASGYSYDLHSPYGVSMHFDSDEAGVESVVINGFSASLEGREIPGISLHNIYPRTPVMLGSESVDLNPAPCCLFSVASDKFELVHKEDETITVRLDYCLVLSGKSQCNVEERLFRAVVRKGLFTMGGV